MTAEPAGTVYALWIGRGPKPYVGSTLQDVEARGWQHVRALEGDYHYNRYLKFYWISHRKGFYGADQQVPEIRIQCLEMGVPEICMRAREQYWMEQLREECGETCNKIAAHDSAAARRRNRTLARRHEEAVGRGDLLVPRPRASLYVPSAEPANLMILRLRSAD
jgi:hypothetical protein